MTVEPILVVLIGLWILFIVLCFGWWAACCCCACLCPRSLQRLLAVLTIIVLVASVLGTAIATHQLQHLWRGAVMVERIAVSIGAL